MIRGYFRGDSPFVDANINLPRWRREIPRAPFLIDTGSHVSVLQGEALTTLGIDPSDEFGAPQREQSVTIAGSSWFGRTTCFLDFPDHAAQPIRLTLRLPIVPVGRALPSILGMDFIVHFRLTISVREDVVLLEPLF